MSLDGKGIFVPVTTPFSGGLGVPDRKALKRNIEKLNKSGVSGYMPLGSNGEAAMMTEKEALSVAETVKEWAGEGKVVFAGAGKESLKETLDFIKQLEALSMDGVFVLTPHYFPRQMTQSVLFDYYMQVAEGAAVPVILYQAPSYAGGVALEPETVRKLSEHPNIIGIKDTSHKPMKECLDAAGSRDFFALAGTFGKFLDGIRQGASGGVLSCANYMPELCCRLYRMICENDPGAERLFKSMEKLQEQTTAPLGTAGIKIAMSSLGYEGGFPRLPLIFPDEKRAEDISRRIREAVASGLERV